MYIGFHLVRFPNCIVYKVEVGDPDQVSSGKKIQGFQTSQFSTIVALLLKFQTFKSSEVKIGRYSKERKLDLSFCDYCCWNIKIWRNRQIEEYLSFFTSPHSLSHPIPSSVMYCEFQILLNHLVIKFSIMDPVILYFQISIKNCNICAIVPQKLQNTDTFVAKITISAHPNFLHFLGLFVQGVFQWMGGTSPDTQKFQGDQSRYFNYF